MTGAPQSERRLNVPCGARCFLTLMAVEHFDYRFIGLNAPFGAGCFLRQQDSAESLNAGSVLMHLLVLGAY